MLWVSTLEEIPKIKTEIPGPKAKKIISESKKYLITTTRFDSLVISRAENDIIEDVDGNIFIDFAAGIAVTNTGHRNKVIIDAIIKQLDRYIHSAPHDFFDDLQYKVAKKLTEITPGAFPKKVFFGNSGTEAIEAAIKIAKYSTKRFRFISFIRGFHGRTHGSLALTASKPVHKRGLFYTMPGVVHVPYAYCYRCPFGLDPSNCNFRCAKFIEEQVLDTFLPPDEVAAIFMEPIQGEGGYIVPPDGFVRNVKRIAEKYDMLFVDDEIQSGFWRSGKPFAIEHYNVVPDIITVAKSIANGVPLSAAISKSELDFNTKGVHSSTFGGNALALAAAIANIEYFQREKIGERVTKLGKHALSILNEFKEETEIVGDVRGKGLMIGVEIVKNKDSKEYATKIRDKICDEALKRGLILLPAGKSALRIAPPLTIREQIFDKGLEILMSIISDIEKGKI